MVKLVVSAEQAKVLTEARESVEILDPKGNRLGFFARPFSDHEIELARSRVTAGQPGRSTADVLERLQCESFGKKSVTKAQIRKQG